MSELFDAGELYEPEDNENPFLGLDGFDEMSFAEPDDVDPNIAIEQEVLRSLDIDAFGGLIAFESSVDVGTIRANRFGDIKEAIFYLSDAGLLRYGQVVLFANGEIGIAIVGSDVIKAT